MRRREKKGSLLARMPMAAFCAGLVVWGLWQAEVFRRSLAAEGRGRDVPVPSVTVSAEAPVTDELLSENRNQGRELVPQPPGPDEPTLSGLDGLAILSPPASDGDDPTARLEPTPAFDAGLSVDELISRGMHLLDAGNGVAARFALNEALARCGATDPDRGAQLRESLAALNGPIFFGDEILPGDPSARLIELQYGDSYVKLGRVYGVPGAFLQALNPALNPRNLKPMTGVKIVQGPFHVRIFRQAGRADVYAREIYVRSMPVSFPEGNFLPRGEYQISAGSKLQLGSRCWIGFEGFEQGTIDVTSGWIFGSAGPRGRTPKDLATGIRLADSDLLRLYNVLVEGRSRLRIEP